ncbi:MAG: (2Fe-2S)-binding protein [Candidatus Eisenbacteria bacterium]|uniref:(2Fe-2S)-binding protein n=1 Tax=Eiseniibacteriota bacterium TaxID=2212470 RepID=A0A948RY14_UNCEI|nr:(2Fe-2S)-binding protein [Candidatus Eisenbacteria bacterium]MBU1947700.1 (2Fe-2S)-binding protein [Candidatus Eisenbacteria bacterium]MBU2692056.1 (2Fe-2S)-binding protein [Candidatus Eisenbacteria bacterium]
MKIDFVLNGRKVSAEGDPMDRLLDLLREKFKLTGTKEGCGEGECGACTVLLDGEPVLSCLVPIFQCQGREVMTVEGVAADPEAQAFLERFVQEGGVQCGACTPGIIVTGWKLSQNKARLRRGEIKNALAGNLCRCTGYEAIVRALERESPS